MESKFWTAEDIELSDDLEGFHSLTGKARSNIIELLSWSFLSIYLAQGLTFRFSDEIQVPEARCFVGFQQMQENIHTELFSLMLDHLTQDQQEMREDTANLLQNSNSYSKKKAFIMQFLADSDAHFGERLTAYVVFLQIFESSAFNLMFHLAKGKLMPGLVRTAAKVRQDRESFTQFYLRVISHLLNKVPEKKVQKMVLEAVQVEQAFITDLEELSSNSLTLGGTLVDFNALKVKTIVCGDHALALLGFNPMTKIKDPLPWIDDAFKAEKAQYMDHIEQKVLRNTPAKKKEETLVFATDLDF